MDPLGIAKDIFQAISVAYIGIALAAVLIALVKPKTNSGKVFWTVLVVAAFAYIPVSTRLRVKQENATFTDACANASVHAQPTVVGSGYAVTTEYLQMGTYSGLYTDAIIRHLLTNKLSYLEINYHRGDWYSFPPMGDQNFWHPYVRLSIQPRGHASCVGFDKWMSEYSAQKLPWIRMLGLTDASCIGAEGVEEIQSRYRVELKEARGILAHETGHGGMWKYHFELKDSQDTNPVSWITSYLNRDWGNWKIMCGKEAEFDQFKASISFDADKRYLNISEVVNDEPASFPAPKIAMERDLASLRAAGNVRKQYVTNLVTPTGTVWIAPQYKHSEALGGYRSGYYLVSLDADKAYKTLIRFDGKPVIDVTGMAIEEGKIKIIAMSNDAVRAPTILEYSRSGEPLRALTPTAEQWESFKSK